VSQPTATGAHYRLCLAGSVATLLGLGLGRFAYTPLITPLIKYGWFDSDQAVYLGAINLLGYMLGAWSAYRLSQRLGERRVLTLGQITIVLSMFACALNWGFYWYALWRLLAGIFGAVLVVVAAPAVMSRVPAPRRPAASAIVFTGVGVGVAATGTVIPWLAGHGVAAAWLGVGVLALVLAWWSWSAAWRDMQPQEHVAAASGAAARVPQLAVMLIIVAYGLDAAGIVPHTLFWVDYIARELGRGLQAGGNYWVLFGVGAAFGPVIAGALASRIGFRMALAVALGVEAVAVGLPLATDAAGALVLSSMTVGAMLQGTVALTAGAVTELAPQGRQQQLWGWATLGFAVMQAASGYAFSGLYTIIGSYLPLYALAAGALLLAVLSAVSSMRFA